MPMPSGARITRDNIEYVNNVEVVNYTMKELIRAALRDCGKLWCSRFRAEYYSKFKRRRGKVGRYAQYWVRSRQEVPDLLIGIKPFAFYGAFQEFGSSKTARYGLIKKVAEDNIDNFQRLQAQYLSALQADYPPALDEEDYEGGANE